MGSNVELTSSETILMPFLRGFAVKRLQYQSNTQLNVSQYNSPKQPFFLKFFHGKCIRLVSFHFII